ncbi:MAG: TonB-dependent receptor [Pyrinomonadaceae bacterium]
MRKFTNILIALLVLLLAQIVIFAQTSGSLAGTVLDPNGAVVAGASVTVRNGATGETRKGTTNDRGGFSFDLIGPGEYVVTIEAAGFKKSVAPNVIVSVSKETLLSITVEIGVPSETVTVTSGQEVINSSSPTLTNVINTRQVVDLPLGDRNPVALAGLQAGIAVVGENVRGASVGGLRQTAVNLTQDGINSMDNFVKTSSFFAISAPSLNSTAEFSITTGTVGSEAGRGAAQVNMVTKGGTNDYHGGAFFQIINNWTDANTWFNNTNKAAKPILRQHFYGFDIGGPVQFLNFGEGVPARWSGRDKAFFFFSYEKFNQSDARERNRTVLTQDARNGIFKYTDTTGVLQTVNLLTLSTRGFGLNPLMTAHLGLIPLPNNNTCGADGLALSCYTFNAAQSTINDKYVARYDHQLVKDTRLGSHKLEFVYSRVITRTYPDVTTNGIDAPFPGGVNGFQGSTRNLITPALVSTFGSNWTNVLRYGRQWAPVDFNRDSTPTLILSLSGVTSYDNSFLPQPRDTQVNQVTDTVSWVNGNHLWKFGADFQNILGISRNDAGIVQTINLGTNGANSAGFVQANLPNSNTTIVGRANSVYANITGLLGSSTRTFNVESPTSGFVPGATRLREVRGRDLALFAQDQWRLKSNFTLNYGVRWDYMGVPTVPNGLAIQPDFKDVYGISGFGNLFKPTAAPGSQTVGVATQRFVSGDTGIGLYKNDWNNFAPYVGFAWSPGFKSGLGHFLFGDEGQSSFRGGYSMSFLREGVTTFTNLLGTGTTNPGLIQTSNTSRQCNPAATPTSNITGVLNTTCGVPLETPTYRIPITDRDNFLISQNNGIWTADPNLRTPYVHQYSFGFEREIAGGIAFELRYQGNFSPNNWRAYNINEVNIFENGFLQEFKNAQINLAARGGTGFAPSTAASPCAACVPLPILDRFFGLTTGGSVVAAASAYGSTTFIANLNGNNVGTMASTLAFNSLYRTNRESVTVGLPGNFFVANPNAAFANILTNDSRSNYNAMQIEVRKRFANGLQFQADYTWSKSMVEGDAQGNNQSDLAQPLTLRNPALDYRRSSQDQTQRFIANGLYELPFGKGRPWLNSANGVVDRIVGGWTMGVIAAWSTGAPFFIQSGRTTFNSSTAGIGADLVGITFDEFKKNIGIYRTAGGILFINPSLLDITYVTSGANAGQIATSSLKAGLMRAPAPGTFGNFPVNSLSGPSFFNVDLSVTKRIPITETVRMEFKLTAINATNHPNFSFGTQSFDASNFGRITSQANLNRRINFIAQVRF